MNTHEDGILASLHSSRLSPIIGRSQAMREAVELARRAAPSGIPVLLVAPTGCGKELFAQYIHHWSGRAGELVDLNCAAIPEALLESELFGHTAEAFTGARRAKPGLIEIADRSSCFLDEIPSLSLPLQAKLLRVIETQELRRVGEVSKRRVDLRFLAAAQEDLGDLVARGLFRADLYQRLAGVVIRIPPLGQRPEDVVPLARHFAQCLGRTLEQSAEPVLLDYPWPGNVRELRMVIERTVYAIDGGPISADTVRDGIAMGAPGEVGNGCPVPSVNKRRAEADGNGNGRAPRLEKVLRDAERRAILDALAEAGGHRGRAAALLGISEPSLYRRLARMGDSQK